LCNIGPANLWKNYPHPCPSPTEREVFGQHLTLAPGGARGRIILPYRAIPPDSRRRQRSIFREIITMRFPYGIADFQAIIDEGYFHVDRTDRIPLLEEAGKQLLFLRPRRFGKSLWLSTLENYGTVNNPVITEDKPHYIVFYAVFCGIY
jgi:hypothetical protein